MCWLWKEAESLKVSTKLHFSLEKHAHTSGKLATGKIWASCSSPGIWTLALSFLKRNKTSESMKTKSNFCFALFIPSLVTPATTIGLDTCLSSMVENRSYEELLPATGRWEGESRGFTHPPALTHGWCIRTGQDQALHLAPETWTCAKLAAPTALCSPHPSLLWWGSLLHPDGCFNPFLPSCTSFLLPFPETPPEKNTFMLRSRRESKGLIKN